MIEIDNFSTEMSSDWPKKPISWIKERVLYLSIPFTWNLPSVKSSLLQRSIFWETAVVGGPAVELMPGYLSGLDHVTIGYDYPGVLQKINPTATRTTIGCVRKCGFCGIGKGLIEPGGLKCLDDWPDLPTICDNNILASPTEHFDRVIDRLKKHKDVDFNQGIDARLLTKYHAKRLSELKIKKHSIRLALDEIKYADGWLIAFDKLRSAGIAKSKISSYALIGFNSDPKEAWFRCEWIEKQGVKALPMWFHKLDQLKKNIVTKDQKALGWNDYERRRIMQWFYKHKKAVK